MKNPSKCVFCNDEGVVRRYRCEYFCTMCEVGRVLLDVEDKVLHLEIEEFLNDQSQI